LKGEYFPNKNLSGAPSFTRIDTVIDFNWMRISPITGSNKGEDFSVRWTGTLTPKVSAIYSFSLASDDGARLYLDGKKIIDCWWDHPAITPYIGFDTLEAGKEYQLVLEYYFTQSNSSIRFEFGSEFTARSTLAKYIDKAKKADIVVFIGGISSTYENESIDRTSIDFPAGERRILKALKTINTPIVLVMLGGSSMSINWEKDNIDAIMMTWYGGGEAGQGIYNVLFGDANPGAKLPVTFYKSENDIPDFENYYMEGRGYRYFRKEPLFPFGFGLSYTTFEYNDMTLPISDVDICDKDTIPVNFTITNTGKREGDEVVQLYTVMLDSKQPQPIKQLKGFKRVNLKPGEKKTETFLLNLNELYYYDTTLQKTIIEPGRYEIQMAASSADVKFSKILNLKNCATNLNEQYEDIILTFYPNPAENIINLKLKSVPVTDFNIHIYSLDGEEVYKGFFKQAASESISINCSGFGTGMFIAKIEEASNKYYKKFVISR
jgi:beta-glucosidase